MPPIKPLISSQVRAGAGGGTGIGCAAAVAQILVVIWFWKRERRRKGRLQGQIINSFHFFLTSSPSYEGPALKTIYEYKTNLECPPSKL